jgi:hypothetical protein
VTFDERHESERGREEEATAAERAAEPEEVGGAEGADERPPREDAPLVSEEGVNEGATDMVREHPTGEPASQAD